MLVLAAVFAAAWVVRRLRSFGKLGAGAIEIIADVALGTKERAVLIQVGAQQLLLGVAPGRVNTLHVLAEPVRIDDAQRGGGGDELSPRLRPSPRPDFKVDPEAEPRPMTRRRASSRRTAGADHARCR